MNKSHSIAVNETRIQNPLLLLLIVEVHHRQVHLRLLRSLHMFHLFQILRQLHFEPTVLIPVLHLSVHFLSVLLNGVILQVSYYNVYLSRIYVEHIFFSVLVSVCFFRVVAILLLILQHNYSVSKVLK